MKNMQKEENAINVVQEVRTGASNEIPKDSVKQETAGIHKEARSSHSPRFPLHLYFISYMNNNLLWENMKI